MSLRIGILTTHPIQYQVPWFRALSAVPGIELEVLYCMIPDAKQQGSGFGVSFHWDVPLLDGYKYRVLKNVSRSPAVTTFAGCDTPDVFRILKEERWDAFIVNGWVAKSCLQLLWACKLAGVPCIVRGESNAIRVRAVWKQFIHRVLLKQYAAYLTIGSQNRAFYLANGVDCERIFLTPYCVENERFKYACREPRRAGAFTFLFSGKLIDKKRPMDVLRAIERLSRLIDPTSFQCLIAGDGDLREACQAYVSQHRLPVKFLGFLNQTRILDAYRSSDCLVLPSDNGETWGLVVNEAMANGMPAIVSDQVGCHPDLIVSGETGFTFPCGDVEKLAERMAQMASAPERAYQMGQRACRKVHDDFGYAQVVQGIMEALHFLQLRRELGAPI